MTATPEDDRLALATALEAVTAAMIHDLSQPLAAIVTSGEACLRWLDRPEPGIADARAAADRIVETAMQAGERLGAYRRPSCAGRAEIDLSAVAREAIADVESESISITLDAAADVPRIEGNP